MLSFSAASTAWPPGLYAAVLLPPAVRRRLRPLDEAADVGDGHALGDHLLGGSLLRRSLGYRARMICSAVCPVRFIIESPAHCMADGIILHRNNMADANEVSRNRREGMQD